MTRAVNLCLAVIVALAAFTASAAAESIEFSPGGTISSGTSELVFISEGGLINPELTCPVTLEGELLEGPIRGSEGETIGDIQSAPVGTCEGGTMRAGIFPWLDKIAGIRIRERGGSVVLVRHPRELRPGDTVLEVLRKKRSTRWIFVVAGVTCEYSGELDTVTEVDESTQQLGTETIVSALTLTDSGGSILCPPRGGFSGAFEAIEPTQTVTAE